MHGIHVGHGDAAGGKRSRASASVRVMWQERGGAIAYVYLPYKLVQSSEYYRYTETWHKDDHSRGDGTSPVFGTGFFNKQFDQGMIIGSWNRIALGIQLNTFTNDGMPRADGQLSMMVNNRSASYNKIKWCSSRSMKIEALLFSTFAGGPDPMWEDGTQFFKNFKVHSFKSSP